MILQRAQNRSMLAEGNTSKTEEIKKPLPVVGLVAP